MLGRFLRGAAVCASVASAVAPARADAATSPSDTVRYPEPADWIATHPLTVQGTRLPDGTCFFEGRVSIPDGSIEAAEVAFTPSTCSSDYIIGTPPGKQPPSALDLPGLPLPPLPLPLPAADPLPRVADGKTYYEDPPQIDVNSASATVAFDSDGYCASSGPHQSEGRDGYFKASGWEEELFNSYESADCAGVRRFVNAKFYNNAFCDAVDVAIGGPIIGVIGANYYPATRTEYLPTRLTGMTDGRAELYWSTAKSGNCQRLLSFHYSLNNSPASVK